MCYTGCNACTDLPIRSLTVEYSTGWIQTDDEFINHDWNNRPLQILTTAGITTELNIWFRTSNREVAGYLGVYITNPLRYSLGYCSIERKNTRLTVNAVTGESHILTINRTAEPRILLYFDGNLLEEVKLSDTVCEREDWNVEWSRDAKMVSFSERNKQFTYSYRKGT